MTTFINPFWKERIERKMIDRAKINGNLAVLQLSDGTTTAFFFGPIQKDIPLKLKKHDPEFYEKLQNEIFDELHPF